MGKGKVMQNIPGQEQSYRESHAGLGPDYHAGFTENPRRALIWTLEQRILSDIAKRCIVPEETDHLDFACGTGRILGYFQGRVRSCTGVDVSASMLRVARGVAPQARIMEGDITREDILAGQKFDLITAFRFFPNAEPELRKDAIEALCPKLRSGGYFVFNNHRNHGSLLLRIGRLLKGRNHPSFSGMSARDVIALVGSVGLDIEEIYHVGILPETERRFIRPRFLAKWIESAMTRFPITGLSEDLIYVCRKGIACTGDGDGELPDRQHMP